MKTIIKNAMIVNNGESRVGSLLINEGKIEKIVFESSEVLSTEGAEIIDAQGQYIAFYRYYKAILSGDKSLIYTLGKALGGDMMSIFTYYLASPFYLIFAFVKEINAIAPTKAKIESATIIAGVKQ